MKKIAVLMTCFNRVKTTLACLERLFAQKMPEGYSFDVWLVDDASPDKTGEKVKAVYPQINVVPGSGNLFWSKGMRLAWDAAADSFDYDSYLWLNDDVLLKKNALAGILADYDAYGGVIVGKFSSDITESDVSYSLHGNYMNGNLVYIPREVTEKVGRICGAYHHQYGDYDFGLHVLRSGMKLVSSTNVCGVCPQQPERYNRCRGKGLLQRVKLLADPRGYDLHDTFLYRWRNWGLCRAIVSCVHVTLKVIWGSV